MRISAFVAALSLAACGSGDNAAPFGPVDHVWVRLPAIEGRPAAAYFDLHGGEAGDSLIAIDSESVASIELHETMTMDLQMGEVTHDGMRMRPIPATDVPAGETVRFEPGGKHAMLFAIDPQISPGTPLILNFRFDSGRDVQVEAATIAAGDANPFAENTN